MSDFKNRHSLPIRTAGICPERAMDCSVFGLIFRNWAISVESSSSSEVWSFRVIVTLYSILCATALECKA